MVALAALGASLASAPLAAVEGQGWGGRGGDSRMSRSSKAPRARGEVLWRQDAGNPTPSVCLDGTLIFHVWEDGAQFIQALDPETGIKKWKLKLPAGTYPYAPSALPDGNMVVGGGDQLLAFNPSTGKSEWSVSDLDAVRVAVGPDATVYIDGSLRGKWGLHALDSRTRKVKWSTKDRYGWPSVGNDGSVFASDQHVLASLDPKTGLAKWTRTLKARATEIVVSEDSKTLYVSSTMGRPEGAHPDVSCLDAETGEVKWQRDFGGGRECSLGLASVGHLIVKRSLALLEGEELIALVPETGATAWKRPFKYLQGFALAGDGSVYVSYSQSVLAFDGMNGRTLWSVPNASGGDVAIGRDGTVFVGRFERGEVMAIR
jgi:outer membrane protein assembly factor BamB